MSTEPQVTTEILAGVIERLGLIPAMELKIFAKAAEEQGDDLVDLLGGIGRLSPPQAEKVRETAEREARRASRNKENAPPPAPGAAEASASAAFPPPPPHASGAFPPPPPHMSGAVPPPPHASGALPPPPHASGAFPPPPPGSSVPSLPAVPDVGVSSANLQIVDPEADPDEAPTPVPVDDEDDAPTPVPIDALEPWDEESDEDDRTVLFDKDEEPTPIPEDSLSTQSDRVPTLTAARRKMTPPPPPPSLGSSGSNPAVPPELMGLGGSGAIPVVSLSNGAVDSGEFEASSAEPVTPPPVPPPPTAKAPPTAAKPPPAAAKAPAVPPPPSAAASPTALKPNPPAPPPPASPRTPSPTPTSGMAGRALPTPSGDPSWVEMMLQMAVSHKASDLHVHVGLAPMVRIDGDLETLGMEEVSAAKSEDGLLSLLDANQLKRFHETGTCELAWSMPEQARFRVSLFRQRRGVDGVFRVIPRQVPVLEELGVPDEVTRFTDYYNGLVLFTGPASCGKSTTLAAVVNKLNAERSHHILTVEDPVEFVHTSDRSNVVHRQVRTHTESFDRALQAALREDPDVIVVGELRDRASMELAISAAETGHLVLGTMHTTGAVRTIARLLDSFAPEEQGQIAVMLSESLRGVVSQRLVKAAPSMDGPKRVPAVEILDVIPAVSNLIRERKLNQIYSVMQTNISMSTLDDALEGLLKQQKISRKEAMRAAIDKDRFYAKGRKR